MRLSLDPLSVTAATVGLLGAAVKISSLLSQLFSNVRDAPELTHETRQERRLNAYHNDGKDGNAKLARGGAKRIRTTLGQMGRVSWPVISPGGGLKRALH